MSSFQERFQGKTSKMTRDGLDGLVNANAQNNIRNQQQFSKMAQYTATSLKSNNNLKENQMMADKQRISNQGFYNQNISDPYLVQNPFSLDSYENENSNLSQNVLNSKSAKPPINKDQKNTTNTRQFKQEALNANKSPLRQSGQNTLNSKNSQQNITQQQQQLQQQQGMQQPQNQLGVPQQGQLQQPQYGNNNNINNGYQFMPQQQQQMMNPMIMNAQQSMMQYQNQMFVNQQLLQQQQYQIMQQQQQLTQLNVTHQQLNGSVGASNNNMGQQLLQYSPTDLQHFQQHQYMQQQNLLLKSQQQFNNQTTDDQNQNNTETEDSKLQTSTKYTPYTLKDYKERKQMASYNYSKGLGDNIGSDDWKRKQEKIERMNEFSQQVKQMNSQNQTKQQYSNNSLPKQSEQSQKEQSSRQKALEFAKNVPKPKQQQKFVQQQVDTNMARVRTSNGQENRIDFNNDFNKEKPRSMQQKTYNSDKKGKRNSNIGDVLDELNDDENEMDRLERMHRQYLDQLDQLNLNQDGDIKIA